MNNNILKISVVKSINLDEPSFDPIRYTIKNVYNGSRLLQIGYVYEMEVPLYDDREELKNALKPYANDIFLRVEVYYNGGGRASAVCNLDDLLDNLDKILAQIKNEK